MASTAPGTRSALGAVSYLNRCAFVNPAPYTFGDLPRSAPCGLFSPGIMNHDISLRRESPFGERWPFLIGADFFNVPNSVYFAVPGTNIDSANFGQVIRAANEPRKFSSMPASRFERTWIIL